VSRAAQDEWALRSQQRYAKAKASGFFTAEIQSVHNGKELITDDEHPRPDSSLEKLAKLKPAFKENGTVTAGNAAGINDGAAALLMMSRVKAKLLGLPALGRVLAFASAGVHPDYMGLGPIAAVAKLTARTRIEPDHYDVVELNEAFAAQVVPCLRQIGLPEDRTNVNGGAIAIGHPIAASGARLAGTALRELARRNGRYALVTMCIGVGQGLATIFERE
jgi:acetyl-CoA acetyltransferase family protein